MQAGTNKPKTLEQAILTGALSGLLIGGIIGALILMPGTSKSAPEDEAAFDLIGMAFSALESTGMPPRDLVFSGIHGMLSTLDPYTQFLESDVYEYMQDQQKGSFYGIGISFDIRNGQLLVISAIEGSPAWKLGIKPGDVISEIEGESTVGITSSDVLKKLRGEKGSRVNIAIMRPDQTEPLYFTLERDKIALNSVRNTFFIDPGIAYVRITEFSFTTGKELKEALKIFSESPRGFKGLILDLRYNGGGLLAAAEDVSSLFLHKNDLIVSTRGRLSESASEIRVKKDGDYLDVPLIVLVNEGSASASEIVAGAIQDHDRGLVIGTTTHGKGLVGSQFPTKFNTAIQITTAQYFTPSNRFIQKPYEIPHRVNHAQDAKTLSFDSESDGKVFATDHGREVFGGGGITPDITVEDPKLSTDILILENQGMFFEYAIHNESRFVDFTADSKVTQSIVDDFLKYCREKNVLLSKETIDEDIPYLKYALLRDIISVVRGYEAGEQIRVKNMVQIKEALKVLPEIEQILASGYGTKSIIADASIRNGPEPRHP